MTIPPRIIKWLISAAQVDKGFAQMSESTALLGVGKEENALDKQMVLLCAEGSILLSVTPACIRSDSTKESGATLI